METRVNGKISLWPKELFDAKSVGAKNLEGWTCLDGPIPLEGNERIDMLIELIRSDLTRQGESCIAESETSEIDQEA